MKRLVKNTSVKDRTKVAPESAAEAAINGTIRMSFAVMPISWMWSATK